MILASTSDIISITTTTTATTQVQASWVDITTTTFDPNRTNTIVSAITTTTIVGSPAGVADRQVKSIVIANRHATSANTVSITHYDGTNAIIVFRRNLLAGESLEYDGASWVAFNAAGIQLINGVNAAGSDTQIQYNSLGILSGNSNLTYIPSTNTLGLFGVNAGISLSAATSDPGNQVIGIQRLYTANVAGKSFLKQIGPNGASSVLQNAQWGNYYTMFTPGAAAGIWEGTAGTNLGTPVVGAPAITSSASTMLRRSIFPSVVTTLNQQLGTRSDTMFFRGNANGLGGFFFAARFMFNTWTTGNRLFVGLANGPATTVTVNPSTNINLVGFGVDASDTAISFMHNDASGTASKDTISSQPALATNNGYTAYIFCKPNDTVVYYRLDDFNAGTVLIDSSTNSDLPVNTTGLAVSVHIGNAANTPVSAATIGISKIYTETDI